VSESNPEEIEAQETRIDTAFSTFGRIGGRPKDSEKERPKGRLWASEGVEKGVSRPKVCDAETGENEAITRQNPPLGEAGFQRQRMFRQEEVVEETGLIYKHSFSVDEGAEFVDEVGGEGERGRRVSGEGHLARLPEVSSRRGSPKTRLTLCRHGS